MEFNGMSALIFSGSSFLLTLVLLFVLRPLAETVGLLDASGGRKQHEEHIPLIGGLAIFCGAYCALWLLVDSFYPFRGIFFACLFIVLLGAIDDLLDLNRYYRLLGQFLSVLVLFFWVYHFLSPEKFQLAFQDSLGFSTSFLLIMITFLGYINAFNMTDGLDGLSGGVAFLQIFSLSFLLYDKGDINFFYFSLIFCAALLAFLLLNFFNIMKFKVFMGDAGSTLMGFLTMALALEIVLDSRTFSHSVSLVWFFLFPIYDFFHVSVYRLLNRKSPMVAGREHFHHLLVDNGLNHRKSVIVIWGLVLMFCIVGVFMRAQRSSNWLNFNMIFTLFFGFYFICHQLRKKIKRNATLKGLQIWKRNKMK